MAAASSNSPPSRPDEDFFYCPICQDVFRTPVKTLTCEHVFCRKCFLTAMKSGAVCPLCRGKISQREIAAPKRATLLELDMRKFYGSCKCCGEQVKYFRMRHHYETCWQYQQEYGSPDKTVHSRPSQRPSGQSGLLLFKCPVCVEDNLDRKSLLAHFNREHSLEAASAGCPICVSMPWGDPSYQCSNLLDHLNARHQFEYDDFMSPHLDEEAQFAAAVAESSSVNF